MLQNKNTIRIHQSDSRFDRAVNLMSSQIKTNL